MALARIKGYITETGELQVELPEGLPSGEVTVTLELVQSPPEDVSTETPPTWTDEEVEAMLQLNPKSGAEIAQSDAIGSWTHLGVEDSVEWLLEQRRKRREKRG